MKRLLLAGIFVIAGMLIGGVGVAKAQSCSGSYYCLNKHYGPVGSVYTCGPDKVVQDCSSTYCMVICEWCEGGGACTQLGGGGGGGGTNSSCGNAAAPACNGYCSSGTCRQMPAVVDIPAYPVRVADGMIQLGIPKE